MIRLSFNKLAEYLEEYINHQGVKTSIIVWSCETQRWLHKLWFEYRDMMKDVFIDGYEPPNIVEDRAIF